MCDGLDYYCRDCRQLMANHRYHSTDRAKNLEAVKIWQLNNKDKVNANSQTYRDANKQKRKEITKKWRDKNKPLTCFLANQRRCNKIKATPAWSEEEEIKALYLTCPSTHEIHHVVPLQSDPMVCGLHCIDNLIVITKEAHKLLHKDKTRLVETYILPHKFLITSQ